MERAETVVIQSCSLSDDPSDFVKSPSFDGYAAASSSSLSSSFFEDYDSLSSPIPIPTGHQQHQHQLEESSLILAHPLALLSQQFLLYALLSTIIQGLRVKASSSCAAGTEDGLRRVASADRVEEVLSGSEVSAGASASITAA